MFGKLLDALLAPAPAELAPADARLALSALLVRIARSDGDYAPDEVNKIDAILMRRYGLDHDGALELRRDAELLEESAPDSVRFTNAIREAVAYEARIAVIEAAWEVVLVDGRRAEEEDALMRMIARFLGVNDRDSNTARLKAQAG